MRGGKRQGAGRKSYGETKVYRLPVALEPEIFKLVALYKSKMDSGEKSTVTKSIDIVKPMFPVLNKKQLNDFRQWLIIESFAKSLTDARKKTETPKLCKQAFLEFINIANESSLDAIEGIMELYVES